MKIAIDLDGVVMKTIEAWISQFHPNLDINEIEDYKVFEHPKVNISEADFRRELENLDYTNVIAESEAILYIHKLVLEDHDVFFLSAKEEAHEKTLEWINRWGLANIPVVFSSQKLEHEFDLLIDDNPIYAGNKNVILFEKPWNKKTKHWSKLNAWYIIFDYIEGYEANKYCKWCGHQTSIYNYYRRFGFCSKKCMNTEYYRMNQNLEQFCKENDRFDYKEVHKLLYNVHRIDQHTIISEMTKYGFHNGIPQKLHMAIFIWFGGTQIEYKCLLS